MSIAGNLGESYPNDIIVLFDSVHLHSLGVHIPISFVNRNRIKISSKTKPLFTFLVRNDYSNNPNKLKHIKYQELRYFLSPNAYCEIIRYRNLFKFDCRNFN